MSEHKAIHLRCNYLENPFGTSLSVPRLSWMMASDAVGAKQTAYQIQVSADEQFADLVWDSDWVTSDESIQIPYDGSNQQSQTRYFWRVRIQNEKHDVSGWSETAWWETGLSIADWKATWIEPEKDVDPKAFKPAPYLRKDFSMKAEIASARLYITAHGCYEAYLNGKRVGDQVFMPGNTVVRDRLQYQAYDVLDLLQAGENCMGVVLGDGWYRGQINANSSRNAHGEKLGLLSQLVITYADGTQDWIVSDGTWKTYTGPIVKSDMKDGEIYDARLEMDGWNQVGFNDTGWVSVNTADHGYRNLVASEGAPIRKMEHFVVNNVITTPKGEIVLDFGQNLAGYAIMKVEGKAGTTVSLQYSEALDEHGNFSLDYLMPGGGSKFIPSLLQQDEYTLRGNGVEIYEPHFTVHGFQYVKVEGYPGEIDPDHFEVVAIYSDMGENGQFDSSNPKLNQLHENVLWSQKGNFLDIPTDCPTRERAGWTGDAQIFVHAGSLLMDDAAFFAKWIKDVGVDQYPSGKIRNFVPAVPVEKSGVMKRIEGSAGWGDAIVIIPWVLYQMYGDKTILEEEYASMKRWVDYMQSRAAKTNWLRKLNPKHWFDTNWRKRQPFIWDIDYHWGEWLEVGDGIDGGGMIGSFAKRILLSDPIVASAYYAYSTRLLSMIAAELGNLADAKEYGELAEKIRDAYVEQFINEDGTFTDYADRQAPYVRALAFGLYNEAVYPKLVKQLAQRLEERGNHLGTGFLSTPFLCDVLTDHGMADRAYSVLLQEDDPSWLYAINKGATTIWEDWTGINEEGVPSASLNHYSKGAVVSWFYEYMCGIQMDPQAPAYRHFFLKPIPGGGLTHARASYRSMYGTIESGWEVTEAGMKYSFTVPANTSATVVLRGADRVDEAAGVSGVKTLDGGVQFELQSGHYEFVIK
ncbi:MAG: family 78 glycoside hydrolase catalytic domain [Anaerolineaceae bacterium]|nr:family 78 glycoside hydrolase catalytic domain [Anaerolineaceae bacterium]